MCGLWQEQTMLRRCVSHTPWVARATHGAAHRVVFARTGPCAWLPHAQTLLRSCTVIHHSLHTTTRSSLHDHHSWGPLVPVNAPAPAPAALNHACRHAPSLWRCTSVPRNSHHTQLAAAASAVRLYTTASNVCVVPFRVSRAEALYVSGAVVGVVG